ncbi:YjiH family protein [Anaeromicrobium sediminis]|uniref:Histidine transporter n=1 Tax=Anaeromicrobium sediminis TaxID=1478221 RepID=A0A267MMS9_9FIRM|nr:YjiH family protein [Anaeromicrobium sediminis]PAB60228.1 histidine transporter [Anaeromicrobium sediminis]
MAKEYTGATNYMNGTNLFRFLVFSGLGIFMFFIPIEVAGKSSIPLGHIVNFFAKDLHGPSSIYAVIIMISGSIIPFIDKSWNKNTTNIIFSGFKILGAVFGAMVFLNMGPDWVLAKNFGPYLYEVVGIKVGLIVPIGAVFLSFIVGYGLIEFIGVFLRPVMTRIWKTPGRSAIDAVASFVGSYSIGLLITNQVFKKNKYTIKEACIIATGFSTVSATFMIVVANTMGIMDMWNIFFWTTLIVTFAVTALTVRMWPLKNKPDTYYNGGKGVPEEYGEGNLFRNALEEGLKAAQNPAPLHISVYNNLKDGVRIVMGFLPIVMSIGLLGLLLAEFTPVFDYFGYIFYPFTLLARLPEPMLAAKASSSGIADMFLPCLIAQSAPLVTRFVIAVVSISEILFFSAIIPVIMATDIPITITDMIIIWIERTIFTILITAPIAHLIL